MGLAYNPKVVTGGLVLSLDAANTRSRLGPNLIPNPTSLASYTGNQNVTISAVGSSIQVVANQTNSTPGVYPIGGIIPCTPNTRYTFRILAAIITGSVPNLYVFSSSGTQLAYTSFGSTTPGWKEVTVTTGSTDTSIRVGALWSGPVLNSTLLISEVGLHQTDTWYDMSGLGANGTLLNGVAYSSANGGSFTFNGTNQSATTSAVVEAATNSNLQTISGWCVGNGSFFGSSAGNIGQFHLRISLSGSTLTFNASYYGGIAGEGNDTATVSPLAVNNIVLVKTSPEKYDVYFNGVRVINQCTKKATVSTNFQPGLYYAGLFSAGTVCSYTIYNRLLSDVEIKQNFNALKGRYGL